MIASRDLQLAMESLGMSAMAYATTMMARLEGELRGKPEAEKATQTEKTQEALYELVRASITCTMKLTVDCSGDPQAARAQAHGLEQTLVAWLDQGQGLRRIVIGSQHFTRMNVQLGKASLAYAAEMQAMIEQTGGKLLPMAEMAKLAGKAREQTYRLMHDAIACTMQLTVDCSSDPRAEVEAARLLKQKLMAFLDQGLETEEPS